MAVDPHDVIGRPQPAVHRRRARATRAVRRPSNHQPTGRIAPRQQGSIKAVIAAIGADRARSTLVLFGIVIVKVLLVSKGDLYTALGVIKTAGVVAVVVGATLSFLPIAAVALLGIGIYTSVSRSPLPAGWRRPRVGAYALLVLAACFILTPRYIVIRAGLLIPLAGGLLEYLLRLAQRKRRFLIRWPQLRLYRLPRIATVVMVLTVIYNPSSSPCGYRTRPFSLQGGPNR